MAWIEVHQGILRHRKISALARLLGVHRTSAVGHMLGFWLWALDNVPSGDLTTIEYEDIAVGAEFEGDPHTFVSALTAVGFLDQSEGGLTIHDWHDYAGRLIERRRMDAERKRRSRELSKALDTPITVRGTSAGHPQDVHAHRTVPNRTELKKETPFGGKEREDPEWLAILKRDPRARNLEGQYVDDVERLYEHVNLVEEATHAVLWLTERGQRYRNIGRFFLSWLKRSAEVRRNGTAPESRPDSIGHQGPTGDEVRLERMRRSWDTSQQPHRPRGRKRPPVPEVPR